MTQTEIRNLVLKAIYLDDTLSELMVLKGGSAIAMHRMTERESFDLDFSLLEISIEDKDRLEELFREAITSYFNEEEFVVFSFKFKEKPKVADTSKPDWGGYHISFKFLPEEIYENTIARTREQTQIQALSTEFYKFIGTKEGVKIELSKKEFVSKFESIEVDDVEIKLYSAEMIIFEKLRAICQQMPEYKERNKKAKRARDFFDIVTVNSKINLEKTEEKEKKELGVLLQNIFKIKNVPLNLLYNIDKYREFHRDNFKSVEDSLYTHERTRLKEYDFYVDETIKLVNWILKELI